MKHTFTWHGHSNFMVESGDKTIIIDPFFSGNPSADISYEEIEEADVILVTHDHGDHVGQALEIGLKTGATIVGIFDTLQKFSQKGMPNEQLVGMNIGGTVTVAGLKIKMVQAMHSAETGAPAGFIVTSEDGFCFYFAGDTGLFSSMELFAKFHDIDLALLPTGGWFTMDSKEAAYACALLKCKKVIPMHFSTFPILEQGTDSFKKYLEDYSPETEMLELSPGKSVTLEK
jgi:L-ascorbate metabolism protein UlaG (beta-lactamase superfamily)